MPHTNSVLVIHPNGTFYAQRHKVAHIAEDSRRGYWRDLTKTVLVVLSVADDQPSSGYEYGGKQSYDRQASVSYCDLRTRTVVEAPIEHRDRTQIPVRDAGGAKVMQLKPLRDRRTTGQHVPRHDRLWRPERNHESNNEGSFNSSRH